MDSHSASENSRSIEEIYTEHVKLIEGRVFYSGVLLKPTRIGIVRGTQENHKIQSLCMYFERSTYGTVCTLDKNLTEHPALRDVKCKIIEMLQEDDCAKRSLNARIGQLDMEDTDATTYMIDAINEYLRDCFNVNQIGISANVVTKDGLLLIGQRSQANIDAKKLYPGVNGNAEVADRKVSFYNLSVYEDYPTIQLDSDRIDFFGEIGREAYGELKLNLPKQEWKCCGVIMTGKMPSEGTGGDCYLEASRRMHFNLIFEHHADKSFREIEELSAKAAEAFETERYLGVSVKCEKNRLIHFLKMIVKGIIGMVSQKDFIEAVVALILFLLAIPHTILEESMRVDTLYQRLKALNWTDAITLFLALLIIIITGLRFFRTLHQYLRRRKKTRSIVVYRRTSYEDVNERVKSALQLRKHKRDLYPLHPVAAACLRYYVDNVICDAFFPNNKR